MSEFKPITFTEEYASKYWDGTSNTVVRYYAYLQRGFALFNETKNYLMLIFGVYWTAKSMEWWLATGYSNGFLIIVLGIAATFGIGVLLVAGRWHLFKASKSIEYITQINGSVTQYQGYNMAVRQLELLEEISKKLDSLSR